MKLLKSLLLGLGLLAFAGLSIAASDRATKEEAKAMVEAAIAHVGKVGWDKAKADFMDKNNATWRNKDLYVFALNPQGVNQAHGANDKMVGKELLNLKDGSGREYIKEMISVAAKGGGWVDYAWPHPDTKKLEDKTSFVKRLPNSELLVGVGAYK